MIIIAIALLWIAIGVTVGIIEGRRGRWRRSWVLFAVFGPLSIPLARYARNDPPVPATVVERGAPGTGDLNVLVGVDGSACSRAAVAQVANALGGRLRRVTLATVLDVDTAASHDDSVLYPNPWPEEDEARRHLADAAKLLTGVAPRTVVLAGDPAAALTRHATEQGDDLIVVGARGRGLSELVFGSCATRLAADSPVPVLVVPQPSPASSPTGDGSPAREAAA
jgi:nucleotide-binding universal stress UspA family protein